MSGINTSGANPTEYPSLESDKKTEVVVVGGGIAGLQIAYELSREGKKVVLLEDGKIGSGETGRTTGHLSVDNQYNDFLSLHGKEGTASIAAAQQAAIERIATIVKNHKIRCDFVRLPGYMFQGLPPTSKDYATNTLKDVYNAAKDTGKLDVCLVDDAGIKGFESGQAIKFENQATFHPTKYIRSLAKIVADMGGEIHEKTRYMNHEETEVGVKITLENEKTIEAEVLVMATNVPLQKLIMIERLEAFRTYAIAMKIRTETISTKDKEALWWDMGDPYHYIRVTPHKEEGYSLLVVGGEDEKVGQHDDYDERYQRLERWTRERWTSVEDVEYKWSGQIADSADGIAYIGLNPGEKNVYIC
ncbi:hypothetical protein M231_03957 [Tremella mesenterica]|uniref:FAD dependent oxidoreductase domain-containing protein n=2 Tax=Tremella mesenterica TaxID=5217 RepID=A0A4Q1BLV6_TREME|nr:hypothetical protein M231_03957 [Tremella mesenterica]